MENEFDNTINNTNTKKDNNNVYINPIDVSNYLFLYNKNSQQAKRITRKMNKNKQRHLIKDCIYTDFTTECIQVLYNNLLEYKKRINKIKQQTQFALGVLTDEIVLLEKNIFRLPPPPLEWHILCLQSTIDKYDFADKNNNIYWCKTIVSDTKHFIINCKYIDEILLSLKQCTSWNMYIKYINTLNIYSVTQFEYSELCDIHVPIPQQEIQYHNYGKQCFDKLRDLNKNTDKFINENTCKQLIHKFDSIYNRLDNTMKYNIFPKISMLCPIDNFDRFFHVLHSFLKSDYPSDKLELVIIDDKDYEKRFKMILPNDSRIKIVNISRKHKDTNEYVNFPLGMKLNLGAKYATHNILYHLFDTNSYFIEQFKDLIKVYLMSNTDIIVSCDTGFYSDSNKNSYILPNMCIENMIYNKNLLKTLPFKENVDNTNVLLYHFLRHRINIIKTLPLFYFSFNYSELERQNELENVGNKLTDFNFTDLLLPSLKESFEMAKNIKP